MNTKMKLLIATLILLSSHALALSQIEPTGQQRAARPPAPTAAASRAPTTAPKSRYERDESVREDRATGGAIERGEFAAGEPDIKVTVDVPAFRLTLWQNGKEVKTYKIGVGMKKYPLVIGERKVEQIIWNPDWIPPDSEWVGERAGVSVGEVIKATDPRNPLGKLKMPLGGGYLIHEAHGVGDQGNLVSHGCVRMVRSDLYDLAEKIVAARSLPVSSKKIANAKRTKNTLVAHLDDPLVVDINYDTHVVEGGVLHLYADVYGRGTNTVEQLRTELDEYGVDSSAADDATLKKMLALPTQRRQYVVSLESVKAGRALEDGHLAPVLPTVPPAKKKAAAKKTTRAA